jgi:hypothetical protein
MRQSGREDRKLSEVRAVLHRLQGLPAERQSAGPRLAELRFRRGYLFGIASTTTVMVTAALVLVFGYVLPGFGPQATSTPKDDPNRQVASLKLPDVVRPSEGARRRGPCVGHGGQSGAELNSCCRAGLHGRGFRRATRHLATVSPAVEAAQALMSTGRVQAARQRLLAMAPDGSPHVAWALARSYDPNHLKGVQGADAGPDVAEATRWYRTWYAAAVKQGMITDSISLEKIVGSMRP